MKTAITSQLVKIMESYYEPPYPDRADMHLMIEEIKKELVEWSNSRPREIICTKCGIREQKGEVPKAEF